MLSAITRKVKTHGVLSSTISDSISTCGNPNAGIIFIRETACKDADAIMESGMRLGKVSLKKCFSISFTRNYGRMLPELAKLLNLANPSLVVLFGRNLQDAFTGDGENCRFKCLRYRGVEIHSCVHPASLIYNIEDRAEEWRNFWIAFRPLVKKHSGKKKKVVWELPVKWNRGLGCAT